MRVLITGGKGQLGRELQWAWAPSHEPVSPESEGRASGPAERSRPPALRQAQDERFLDSAHGEPVEPGAAWAGGTDVLAPDIDELDVTDADAVERAVQRAKPELLVHAAA